MRLTMEQKRAVTGKLASKYRGSKSRKDRSQILNEVQELTGYNRHYAAWLLRNYGKRRAVEDGRGQTVELVVGGKNKRRATERPRAFNEAVKREIVFLWECFDQMYGKCLVAMLSDILPVLVQQGRVNRDQEVHQKLLHISVAAVDRILKCERAKRRLKGNTHTKLSSILKNQLPIIISSELDVSEPGHYQIDLVGHDGGNPNGHFAFNSYVCGGHCLRCAEYIKNYGNGKNQYTADKHDRGLCKNRYVAPDLCQCTGRQCENSRGDGCGGPGVSGCRCCWGWRHRWV